MEQNKKQKFVIDFLYYSFVFVLIYFLLRVAIDYLFPFIIGGIIAVASRKICEKRLRKNVSLFSVFTVIFIYIVLAVLITSLIIFIYSNKQGIANFLSDTGERLIKMLSDFAMKGKKLGITKKDINTSAQKIITDTVSKISKSIAGFAVSISKILLDAFVVIASSIYIAKDYTKLKEVIKNLIGNKRYTKITEITAVGYQAVKKLLSGYVLLFFLTFLELSAVFIILRIQFPVFLAFLVAFVDILPILGVGTVLIPWAIAEFLSRNVFLGSAFLISYLIITVVRAFLEPHIIGKKFNINPLFTLLLIFVGLKFGGFIGVITVPVAVIVIVAYYKNETKKI